MIKVSLWRHKINTRKLMVTKNLKGKSSWSVYDFPKKIYNIRFLPHFYTVLDHKSLVHKSLKGLVLDHQAYFFTH